MAKSSVTIRSAWIGAAAVIAAALIGLLGSNRTSEPPSASPRAAQVLETAPGQPTTAPGPVEPRPSVLTHEMTMQQYFDRLNTLRQRYLERDDFIRGLQGKRVLWRGFVGGVTGRAPQKVHIFVKLSKDEVELRGAYVTFESSWETKLYSLREGDLVQVDGEYEGETPMIPSIRGVSLTVVEASQK